jgi:uncharacterized protein YcbK (DUF882 family)
MQIISKFQNVELCDYLMSDEMRCKCHLDSCRATIISDKLLRCFEDFRTFVDLPIYVTSGFRCMQHNFDVGGKQLSKHLIGKAIDFSAKNILEVYEVGRIEFMAKDCGFRFVKYYPEKNFFHFNV